MFDRFTERARKVMSLARQEAQRFHHDYIGTEHILLGLLDEGSGVAAQVLRNVEIDSESIRREVQKIVRNGTRMITFGQLPFTPGAKRVLEFSLEEAQNLAHNYIGTEHLLLGLLRERESIAGQVLVNLGAKIGEVREEVLELFGDEPGLDRSPPREDASPFGASEEWRLWLRTTQEQAMLRLHRAVGTEHMLLGVALQPGPAADLLSAAGATADSLAAAIGRLRANGNSAAPHGFTPCASGAMRLAAGECGRRGGGAPGLAHLLFGLLSVPEGLAVTALTNIGVNVGELRANVSKLLDAG